ncbi:hypothetical protein [Amycolatopsis sp. NPDC051372]
MTGPDNTGGGEQNTADDGAILEEDAGERVQHGDSVDDRGC